MIIAAIIISLSLSIYTYIYVHMLSALTHLLGHMYKQAKCFFSSVFCSNSDASDHFHADGSDVTMTIYCTCAQEFVDVGAKIAGQRIPNTEDTPPETPQQRLFGEIFTKLGKAGRLKQLAEHSHRVC